MNNNLFNAEDGSFELNDQELEEVSGGCGHHYHKHHHHKHCGCHHHHHHDYCDDYCECRRTVIVVVVEEDYD